jgi:hypothetical protein
VKAVKTPLVFITSNNERSLPAAFLRRCVIHKLQLPTEKQLVKIAEKHFPDRAKKYKEVFSAVAKKIVDMRKIGAEEKNQSPPSTAEYLDAVSACLKLKVRPGKSVLWKAINSAVLQKKTPVTFELYLGDLVRAIVWVGRKKVGDHSLIADLLGFEYKEISEASQEPDQDEAPNETSKTTPKPDTDPKGLADTALPRKTSVELIEFEMKHKKASHAIDLPKVSRWPERQKKRPRSLAPLFNPITERGVLIETLGNQRPEGEVAILEVVDLLARGQPLEKLPREKIQTLSQGCHILVDYGIGMQPFTRDTEQLITSINKVAGEEHTQVFTFVDSPLNGVLTKDMEDIDYEPPGNDASVLAITDFGAGSPRGLDWETRLQDWLILASRVYKTNSSFVVLNPYISKRWPPQLIEELQIVYWDRQTKASDVRQSRRKKINS